MLEICPPNYCTTVRSLDPPHFVAYHVSLPTGIELNLLSQQFVCATFAPYTNTLRRNLLDFNLLFAAAIFIPFK